MRKYIIVVLIVITTLFNGIIIKADNYKNEDNGYLVIIEDEADLLSDEEERKLMNQLKDISNYGNVAFFSRSKNSNIIKDYDTSDAIESYYHKVFGNDSGVVFMIDMARRNIYIFAGQKMYQIINKSYANNITDNVYVEAKKGNYYLCASKAFNEIYTILEGGRIAQPMKYITSFLMAIITAILINFIIMLIQRSDSKVDEISATALITSGVVLNKGVNKVIKTYTYNNSSSSSGSGGGFGSGSGGSSGGFSGGGGGHSF